MHWKPEEVEFLKENYSKNEVSMREMSRIVDKTIRAIHHKAAREGLFRPRFPSDKPSKRTPRRIIDKRYYENNKDKIYHLRLERKRKLKSELVNLLGGKCELCGYNRCPAALEFHHSSKNKENNPAVFIKNDSRQKSLKEAKKCTLLCANCHRETHHRVHSSTVE